MIILGLDGGLGNQMFQYAFFLCLKKRYPSVFFLLIECPLAFQKIRLRDLFILSQLSRVQLFILKIIHKLLRFIIFRIIIKITPGQLRKISDDKRYDRDNRFPTGGITFVQGSFQRLCYVGEVEDKLRDLFRFPPLTDHCNRYYSGVAQSSNSIAIHIRRGDYLNTINSGIYVNISATDFYRKAIRYIEENVENPVFFIFSNDMDWCKSNLEIKGRILYVDCNQGDNSWKDMQLMSICKHNIISNSTFSWWAAWLNANKSKIVIVPDKWFITRKTEDIIDIPDDWIRI